MRRPKRGKRLRNLETVEEALRDLALIGDAVVTSWRDPSGLTVLVAHVVPSGSSETLVGKSGESKLDRTVRTLLLDKVRCTLPFHSMLPTLDDARQPPSFQR